MTFPHSDKILKTYSNLKCFPKMDAQFKHSENSISCKILSAVSNIIGKNLTKYPQVTNCHNYGLK